MNITTREIEELVELLKEAESYRPGVRMILDAVKSYGPELAEIPEALGNWIVDNRIKHVKRYEDAGFSKQDAIDMTLDDVWAIRRVLRNNNSKG